MSHRFDGGCMDPKYGGEAGSEPPHVAQQSRRDKLRVQGGQQFGHDPNPNPSHDFIYSSAAAGMLDFASAAAEANEANNSFLGAGGCDWIVNSAGPSSSSMYGDYNNFSHHSLHFSPLSSSYHNTLHEVVAPSSNDQGGLEMMGSLSLPPPPMPWLDTRQLFQHQYDQEFPRNDMPKVAGGGDRYQINQGLSLSLSSNPPPSQLDARGHSASLDPRKVISSGSGSSSTAGGPLGPFTGYATILKSSKFLKPAQQLLDEFCSAVTGSSSRGESASSSAAGLSIDGGAGIGGRGANNSGMSPSSFYSSTEGGSSGGQYYQQGGVSCDQVITPLPEIQQKKVKLLYLQDEVCRRYKQYHQQMQMVVSSFESVAGISAATPYTSLAVKSVSKHFRCVKNAISDQLRQVSKLVGEELMSSPSSASRGETTMTPRLKYVDQGFRKHRGGENSSLGFMENNQPVWRPQRGLPERAVAVLRAWLFEHFLHPYPTDTDKHMLATQTGLSRNQVSNWFINARVRLWKPMVEEIHSLESKGMAEMDLNSSNKKDGKAVMDDNGAGRPYHDQLSEAQSNKSLDPTSMGGPPIVNESSSIDMEQWHREKRTRMEECAIPQNMDGGLMSFAYQGGMDLGSLGAVSLTLGLRHNEDPQQQQQQQQQMRHFGSQMLHDFVG